MVLLLFGICFSQDIKLKKGNVLVDGNEWLKYDGCGGFDQTCSISNLEGEEVIYMKLFSKIQGGDEKYWKVNFLGTQMSLDLDFAEGFGLINGRLLKKFYDAKVIGEEGSLDEDRVIRMVEKFGSPFTDKLNATNNTIIINNNQEPQKSGININIGR